MIEISLENGKWKLNTDKLLGQAGSSRVYEGIAPNGGEVAIKQFLEMRQDLVLREFDIAEFLVSKQLQHVVPVFDKGFDENSGRFYLVMAKAEHSLQDSLKEWGSYDDEQAAGILTDIAMGLREVPDIVHRDLKPANVLWHGGRWKLADFGIARFVEKATTEHTLKHWKTSEYAAPEQWRQETATAATDVYALGCVGYALLTGKPPFDGPSPEDYRNQHLNDAPRTLTGPDPTLCSLLMRMLRKTPESRPNTERIIEQLLEVEKEKNEGLKHLAEVGARIAAEQAGKEAGELKAATETERRTKMARTGFDVLKPIVDELMGSIQKAAAVTMGDPALQYQREKGVIIKQLALGLGVIDVRQNSLRNPMPAGLFPRSRWDVILGCTIGVTQTSPKYEWRSSLWYVKFPSGTTYRWHEVAYMNHPLMRSSRRFQPFPLDADDADRAASTTMDSIQIAFGPHPIDDEHVDEFINRWAQHLSLAAAGKFSQPRSLPIDKQLPMAKRQW